MNIILLGPPGAGKGTQALKIREKFSLVHISTGDILRSNVKENTDLGKEAASYMESGRLVPTELVLRLIEDRLKKDDVKQGIMLDGFPRNLEQASFLDEVLEKLNLKIDKVINIKVDKTLLTKRITGRRTCGKCMSSYHIDFNPPTDENICNQCSSELIQRPDDIEETVVNRIEVYEKETLPLSEFYTKQNKIIDIDGSRSVEDVFSQIENALEDVKWFQLNQKEKLNLCELPAT